MELVNASEGLTYLHQHVPPVFHSDLKPVRLFVISNTGFIIFTCVYFQETSLLTIMAKPCLLTSDRLECSTGSPTCYPLPRTAEPWLTCLQNSYPVKMGNRRLPVTFGHSGWLFTRYSQGRDLIASLKCLFSKYVTAPRNCLRNLTKMT